MSQPAPTNPPSAATFPYWWDYLFMLLGCGISLVLAHFITLRVTRSDLTPDWLPNALIAELPRLLLLPVGIYLWWPVFFLLARFRGRSPQLSVAEWLWGFVWIFDLALVAILVWLRAGELPSHVTDFIDRQTIRENLEVIVRWLALGLAGSAVLIALLVRTSGAPKSWTHHFAVALMLWPLVPVGLIVWCGLRVGF
jgi:hypothetical protein